MNALTAAKRTGELLVAELFGPTVQGEGPSVGQRAMFIRLSGCHLSCSWCDTAYTWDTTRFDLAAHRTTMNVDQVLGQVLSRSVDLAVITGGEPLLQQVAVGALARELAAVGLRTEVETSGTVRPAPCLLEAVTAFNVSPKLANSGLDLGRRRRPGVLVDLALSGKAVFKFVASGLSDLDEIAELERKYGLTPIWVMPEGRTAEVVLERMRMLADPVLARGWRLTPRLHVLLWGDQRGR